MARRRDAEKRLATPAVADTRRISPSFSPDVFGRFAEGVARYLGTARFLIIQTIVIILWIACNELVYTFDNYPYILLTLALSMQASYAAPLILLAQNRQEDRDREALERDRDEARRTQQDTEYLARELASIRIALADVATAEDLERSIERVLDSSGAARKKAKKKKQLEARAADEATGPDERPESEGGENGDEGDDDGEDSTR
ncbi:MAG: DUF1003 domain-containing protein [Acidimicrobiales bacterium]